MMMLSRLHSNKKMNVKGAIITYAALAMVAVLLIVPVTSAPLPVPSAATVQESPPSQAASPKSSKKKANLNPAPATDETVKVSSK
jgi:hypothetical protein